MVHGRDDALPEPLLFMAPSVGIKKKIDVAHMNRRSWTSFDWFMDISQASLSFGQFGQLLNRRKP